MTSPSDILEAVRGMAMETEPYGEIVYGTNPPYNGICMIADPSATLDIFKNKGMIKELSILINAKHENQKTVYDTLCTIHRGLTKRWSYPNDGEYQIIDIETTSDPNLIGQEESGQWIYGSSVRVRYFWR